ncbi:hypothetical protein [Xanthomonas phaseoli]|nr:hypothetical protein [Xanthomonas phaseoli]MBO9757781.1 hypothetical protein [Xanthomonas phaseoli pv. manihotis]UEQ13571.1 hypothetical protein K9838_12575 [Xanthomonas phaseoli pv. manihotis]
MPVFLLPPYPHPALRATFSRRQQEMPQRVDPDHVAGMAKSVIQSCW